MARKGGPETLSHPVTPADGALGTVWNSPSSALSLQPPEEQDRLPEMPFHPFHTSRCGPTWVKRSTEHRQRDSGSSPVCPLLRGKPWQSQGTGDQARATPYRSTGLEEDKLARHIYQPFASPHPIVGKSLILVLDVYTNKRSTLYTRSLNTAQFSTAALSLERPSFPLSPAQAE